MMNILPQEEQKKIRKEYVARLIIVALTFLLITIGVAFILLAPRYFSSKEHKQNLASYLNVIDASNVADSGDLLKSVVDVKKKIELLRPDEKNTLVYEEVFAPAIKKRGGIQIKGLLYERTKTQEEIARITGTAPNRDSLLKFVQALKEEKSFVKVDVPVSDFVEDANIEFSINISLL